MKRVYKKEYDKSENKKQKALDGAVAIFRQQQQAKKKLAPSDSCQNEFNRYLVEMIAVDGLPPSFFKGLGFNRLLKFLKPKGNLMFPRTMGRFL
ncbi:hypothetical protein IscW_ISCW014767 [Ixodes scapularis]|uniref:Uncharacterized protein n=1 Tax=Ixodes scapularis TaxID=6945 RepID=B7QKR0_IXOSC|nr:hypothetical protein IscW_ISCW014767 [Ixodes scapularis]|eukprot:XP_002415765.1 hypothetical protein IscW_ISCW014767 [Ixodes scapularis]